MNIIRNACRALTRNASFTPILTQKRTMLKNSINHILNKNVMNKYQKLKIPEGKILTTYVWIDGSGINMRSKDRVLQKTVSSPSDVPDWAFDGSSTGQATTDNSDTKLKPVAVCPDPFRLSPHTLVLCEVYLGDDKPAKTNNRNFCSKLADHWKNEDPWFGLEQEYTMLDMDGWGLGWPKGGGFPAVKYEFSYCGVGAKYISGRDISESHARACLYSNLDFEGTNAEVMYACWEFQIGTSKGMKGPDDLWLARFIMSRVSEEYGAVITYHPKPLGEQHPGVGMHHNFSTKKMRSDGGFEFIKECIGKLEKNHMKHMKLYSNNELANRMRLSGKFETSPFEKFSWGIASRTSSIRLQRHIEKNGKGFMEDRRPGGDCDPYLVCGLLMETCLGPAGAPSSQKSSGSYCKPSKPSKPNKSQAQSRCSRNVRGI